MASSRKSKRSSAAGADLTAHVSTRLAPLVTAGSRLTLGLSGGIDSVVLLDILAQLRSTLGFSLEAVHVDHGLSAHAAAWGRFSRAICREREIECRVTKVAVERSNSVERAAREARYAALLAARSDYVVLAHSRDDQAETVLLQLLRGTGVRGLAGMPFMRRPGFPGAAPALLRPLLGVSRSDIEHHARSRGLGWIEDESNLDTRFARNWIRRDVLPGLEKRLPAVRQTLARAAANMSEASELLDELACIDLQHAGAGEGRLRIETLTGISAARAKNVLRFAIAARGWRMPTSERLEEALRQISNARADAVVRVAVGDGDLRCFRSVVHFVSAERRVPAQAPVAWTGQRLLELPGWGRLEMRAAEGEGLSTARLAGAPVTVRRRSGGERLQPAPDRPRRTVKNLLHEAAVPPWERAQVPCIYSGDVLACVPGLAIDYRYRAHGAEPAIVPVWQAL